MWEVGRRVNEGKDEKVLWVLLRNRDLQLEVQIFPRYVPFSGTKPFVVGKLPPCLPGFAND